MEAIQLVKNNPKKVFFLTSKGIRDVVKKQKKTHYILPMPKKLQKIDSELEKKSKIRADSKKIRKDKKRKKPLRTAHFEEAKCQELEEEKPGEGE